MPVPPAMSDEQRRKANVRLGLILAALAALSAVAFVSKIVLGGS
jgi:hypothetical protein